MLVPGSLKGLSGLVTPVRLVIPVGLMGLVIPVGW